VSQCGCEIRGGCGGRPAPRILRNLHAEADGNRTRLPARRRYTGLEEYFEGRPFRFFSYRDDREDFGLTGRTEYFASIRNEALQRSVVFFDPDVGMEPGLGSKSHLRFSELAGVQARMDEASVAVVFQYARRVTDFWTVMARSAGCARVP
jgi:hypothetical protein